MKRSAFWHPKTADLWLTKWDEDHFVCWVRSGFKLTFKSRLSLEIKAGRRRWNLGKNLANFCCSDHCKNARFLDLDAPSCIRVDFVVSELCPKSSFSRELCFFPIFKYQHLLSFVLLWTQPKYLQKERWILILWLQCKFFIGIFTNASAIPIIEWPILFLK